MQHRRLSNDNSVQGSLSGMGTLHEEKTAEDAKQAQAPVFDGMLKNDHGGVGNGVGVSRLATIPRITMKDAFVLPSRSMYGTAVEVRCGKLMEDISPAPGGHCVERVCSFVLVGRRTGGGGMLWCILVVEVNISKGGLAEID